MDIINESLDSIWLIKTNLRKRHCDLIDSTGAPMAAMIEEEEIRTDWSKST